MRHRRWSVPSRRLQVVGLHVVRKTAGSLMDAKQLRGKSAAELTDELLKLRKEQFALRMQRATGQSPKPDQFTTVRRNIARLKTVQREQATAAAGAGSKK